MQKAKRHFDPGSVLVIFITFVLFGVALLEKGLTHDLLVEAGVFLVSVKLIILGYKNSVMSAGLKADLAELKDKIDSLTSKR